MEWLGNFRNFFQRYFEMLSNFLIREKYRKFCENFLDEFLTDTRKLIV